jgi:glycosyltransferase involved in cell wall biosynthesis
MVYYLAIAGVHGYQLLKINMRTVSLAIPTYNRFSLLVQCVEVALADHRIDEIIIVDDASTEDIFNQLKEWADPIPNVFLHFNRKNLDCYANKQRAVMRANNPFVILFDSDNIIDKVYLDALFAIPKWDDKTIYCPTYAWPDFDYRAFEGANVNRGNVKKYLDKPHFLTALNTANYMVPCHAYLHAFNPDVNPHTADSIYMAYRFLELGYTLEFVKGMHYFHRVHEESHYKKNRHLTGMFYDDVVKKLRSL